MSARGGIVSLTLALCVAGCGAGDSSAPPGSPSCPDGVTAPADLAAAVATYRAAWSDAGVRACQLASALAAKAELLTREGAAVGPDAIAARMAASATGEMKVTSELQTHHDFTRFTWSAPSSSGVDFLLSDAQHRLVRVARFEDDAAATPPSPQVQAYIDSWNEPDAMKRTALLQMGFRDDARYVDPTVDAVGRAAFVDHIGGYRKSFPGTALSAPQGVVVHGRAAHLPWEIRSAKGALVLSGVDSVLLAEDGRIALVTGFFGSLAPAP